MDQAGIDRAWRRRAESAVRDTRPRGRALGRLRAEIRSLETEALAELTAVDAALDDLLRRRLELTRRIRDCHRALTGTDDFSRKTAGRHRLPEELTPPAAGRHVLAGAALGAAVADVLGLAGRALRTVEIHEVLLAGGLVASGDQPLRSIWNALRSLRRRGLVEHVGRGTYRAA